MEVPGASSDGIDQTSSVVGDSHLSFKMERYAGTEPAHAVTVMDLETRKRNSEFRRKPGMQDRGELRIDFCRRLLLDVHGFHGSFYRPAFNVNGLCAPLKFEKTSDPSL